MSTAISMSMFAITSIPSPSSGSYKEPWTGNPQIISDKIHIYSSIKFSSCKKRVPNKIDNNLFASIFCCSETVEIKHMILY